jgi:hypothetical protein
LWVGTVQSRTKISAHGAKGPWAFSQVEVQGIDGPVNDPAPVPENGAPILVPAVVGQKGNLREARHLGAPF